MQGNWSCFDGPGHQKVDAKIGCQEIVPPAAGSIETDESREGQAIWHTQGQPFIDPAQTQLSYNH